MRTLFGLITVVSLSACSSAPVSINSPYFQIPVGSKIVLNQALTIPANSASVHIQYAKIVNASQVDKFYANCSFLSWVVRDHAQTINPDTFTITDSQQLEDVVRRQTKPEYASNVLSVGMFYDGGPMALAYSTQMRIHSDKQPDIRQFTCSYWENPDDAQHMTVAQMQQVLGNIARIEVKQAK